MNTTHKAPVLSEERTCKKTKAQRISKIEHRIVGNSSRRASDLLETCMTSCTNPRTFQFFLWHLPPTRHFCSSTSFLNVRHDMQLPRELTGVHSCTNLISSFHIFSSDLSISARPLIITSFSSFSCSSFSSCFSLFCNSTSSGCFSRAQSCSSPFARIRYTMAPNT